jgi:imidazolonepropionase-like amidohydrolase
MNLGGQVGTIVTGAYADLLLIDGDPLTNISILTTPEKSIKFIMLEGEIITNRLEARAGT